LRYVRETLGAMAAATYVGFDQLWKVSWASRVLLGSMARGPMGMPAEWAVSSSKKYADTIIALLSEMSDI
jgi:hypothetical protein